MRAHARAYVKLKPPIFFPANLSAYPTEQQAREHCPSDVVVSVDPQSGTYQLTGHGSYGLSDTGRYACRGEAERGDACGSQLTLTGLRLVSAGQPFRSRPRGDNRVAMG
jgi:hypothetical protein